MKHLQAARGKMSAGQYQEAFDLIVDQEVQSLSALLKKIECMVDIGFIIRDERILRYGLYLLEKHGSEVLEVEDLAPVYFLNLANQYINMVTLSSYNNEYFGYYEGTELIRAREFYEKALSYGNITGEIAVSVHLGLARALSIGGRGAEALEHYQAAVKLNPDLREALLEKAQLMIEYAGINSENSRIIMKEAWHLSFLTEEMAVRDAIDDQQELEIRGKIRELVPDRSFLESEEEYPQHSIVTNSEEEHRFTMFTLRHNLYLNLCGFCRKCDCAVGDQLRLRSSSLTIRTNQKKRFTSLAVCYSRLNELYRVGRYFLTREEAGGKPEDYTDPGDPKTGLTGFESGSIEYYFLREAYLHGWDLWDSVKDYLATYWDKEVRPEETLYQMLHSNGKIRDEWKKKSPSFHAVYDLFMDCFQGRRKYLKDTYLILKRPLKGGHSISFNAEDLKKRGIELYKIQRSVILYLGIMHERNEFQNQNWIFPRPLYNFFMSGKELKDK